MDRQYISLRIACDLIRTDYPHTLEFGVASGHSIRLIRELVSGDVFGFDTFTGLPTDWLTSRGNIVQPKGTFDCGGKHPDVDGVTFYSGLFKDTIPTYREIAKPIRLLHIDCDLYSSTLDVLDGVGDFLSVGSIIVFDEWQYYLRFRRQDHEAKAFLEWAKRTQRAYQFVEVKRHYYPVDAKIVRILDGIH